MHRQRAERPVWIRARRNESELDTWPFEVGLERSGILPKKALRFLLRLGRSVFHVIDQWPLRSACYFVGHGCLLALFVVAA